MFFKPFLLEFVYLLLIRVAGTSGGGDEPTNFIRAEASAWCTGHGSSWEYRKCGDSGGLLLMNAAMSIEPVPGGITRGTGTPCRVPSQAGT